MKICNSYKSRLDNEKHGPSGMSCNISFSLPQKWGGKNYLLPVDLNVIQELKEAMDRDSILNFVSMEFSEICQRAYDSLHVKALTFENVWYVFWDMFSIVFPHN